MTTAAAEGWAHYLGSRTVDGVHGRLGADLWPDKYDYLADGMKRLDGQLAQAQPAAIAKGAGLWKELVAIVGNKGVAPIFAAWNKVKIDPADPHPALEKALLAVNSDKRLSAWWDKAEAAFVLKRPGSGFAARTAKPAELTGKTVELAHDDGAQAGRRSIAGGGHAVSFQVKGDSWYLTAIRIHGARYGQLPRKDFHLWLCDADFRVIADFSFPYSKFALGQFRWVTLAVTPTNVPPQFILCAGFDPTASTGVFVSHNQQASGNSLTGLPGRPGRRFDRGDWLIRAELDQLKTADSLQPTTGTASAK